MDELNREPGWIAAADTELRSFEEADADAYDDGQSASTLRQRAMPHLGFASREDAQRVEQAFMSLSAREITVLAYLAHGFSAKEVAHSLNVSSRTIDTFRTRALLKLRARNTADAVRMLATLSARAHQEE